VKIGGTVLDGDHVYTTTGLLVIASPLSRAPTTVRRLSQRPRATPLGRDARSDRLDTRVVSGLVGRTVC
jgi:hypothetical protein